MDSPAEATTTTWTVNAQELLRLLTDLQVGIRKYSLYSGSHAIIPKVVSSLTARFHSVLGAHDTLQIGVTKEEILYQGTSVAAGNPVICELARMLNQLSVAGVTIRREVTESDVLGLLRLLAECRRLATPEDQQQAIQQFGREVASLSFQFVTFRGAVKERDAASSASATADASQFRDFWRGLIQRLLAGDLSEEARGMLEEDATQPVDAERVAAAVNGLGPQRKTGGQSYERTIVTYLHEQATATTATNEQRAQIKEQIQRLFAKLDPAVRQQIFHASFDPSGEDTAPAETLLDALPGAMLVEILDQLQVANCHVSTPTFSLLKKFATLAESDQALAAKLEAKLGNQKDVLQELLTKRVDRTFYPEQYRALLDKEFAERSLSSAAPSGSGTTDFDDEAVAHHLSLVLLEMLEAPIRSDEQFMQTVCSLKEVIARTTSDQASSVFNEAIAILAKRSATAGDDRRDFFRECVRNLFQPDLAHHLLGPLDAGHDQHKQREVLAHLLEIIGPSLIPLLLDKLETEENLKARKRLLTLLRDCGEAVVPLAVQRLGHSQWYVVRNMLLLLRDVVATQAVPDIARCLNHASAQVRLAAFQALSALAPHGATFRNAIKLALDDADPKVFGAAVTQLVANPNQQSLELADRLLLADATGRHGPQQVALLQVIEQIGTPAMLPLLRTVRRHYLLRFWSWRSTRSLRVAATRALSAIRERQTAPSDPHRGSPHEQVQTSPQKRGPDTSPVVASETILTRDHVNPQDPV